MKSAPVMTRALVFGAVATGLVAVVGSVVGVLVAGIPGLLSALIGAGLTAVFMGVTSLSVLLAQRATRGRPTSSAYYGIVLGMLVAKFAVFAAVLILVREASWMSPYVFFFSLVAAVIASLIADVVALQGAQVTHTPVDGI